MKLANTLEAPLRVSVTCCTATVTDSLYAPSAMCDDDEASMPRELRRGKQASCGLGLTMSSFYRSKDVYATLLVTKLA